MKRITIFLFIFINGFIWSQNLVLNPSFEDFYDCPKGISFFHNNVRHWTIPNNGTTDYFNSCSEKTGYNNFIGNQKARTGNGYAGIYTFYKKNYREYIQGVLKRPLLRGKTYRITFYLSLADSSKYALKELGFMTTSKEFNAFESKTNINAKVIAERVPKVKYRPIVTEQYLDNVNEWTKISFTYVAEGFEKYFSIGNFNSNSLTEKRKLVSKADAFSYYYIDDVTIEPLEKDEENVEEISTKPIVETNKIYAFQNVLFKFDKAELLPSSIGELEMIVIHLKENPNLVLEIYGHTDNTGEANRNKELSRQRAKAVAEYLISQGLDTTRIKPMGFGSSKPISENETEEGRQLNRRVEFKFIEN